MRRFHTRVPVNFNMAASVAVTTLLVLLSIVLIWLIKWGDCNLHESGHYVVGRLLGIPIADIDWCGPRSLKGEVIPKISENSVRFSLFYFSGGLISGAGLLAINLFIFANVNKETRSLIWLFFGLLITIIATTELFLGLFEGIDHVAYQQSGGKPALWAIPIIVGIALHGLTIRNTTWGRYFKYLFRKRNTSEP